jgi:Tfp pilus assembly protein PilX
MFINKRASRSQTSSLAGSRKSSNESGAALATALLMLALLSAIAMTVLAVVRTETRIAGSDLKRTQTFYASAAGIEKMTSDFSQLFTKTARPTDSQLALIKNSPPVGLSSEGYDLVQTLDVDTATLDLMRTTQGIPTTSTALPNAVMGTDSPFAGLNASVKPYTLSTRATSTIDGTQVALTRQMNNYLIPIFQFGVFSDKDLEFWPQPPMTFNGRVHANGNIYFGGDVTFLQRVTTANEAVRDKLRNNALNNTNVGGTGGYASNPRFKLDPASSTTIAMTQGSVLNGPNLSQPRTDGRGNFPGSPAGYNASPTGTDNSWWKTNSKTYFGGLMLSKSTGVLPLKLPLQLQEINKQPLELIKRSMPDDSLSGFDALNDSRYQNKAQIRILIDDENAGSGSSNAAGIPAGKGVLLSTWTPSVLDSGAALRIVADDGTYRTTTDWWQGTGTTRKAETVRAVRNDYAGVIPSLSGNSNSTTGGFNATATNFSNGLNSSIPRSPSGGIIPPGSGVTGRILIEIVPPPNPDGTQPAAIDVTQTVLSMGVTVGEPNAIIMLQRPEWAAFMQGERDRKGTNYYLNYFLDNGVSNRRALADGEVSVNIPFNSVGFITGSDNSLDDDPHSSSSNQFLPTTMARDDKPGAGLNKIVPINLYNVREGHIDEAADATLLYQRGITSVIDINMRNLARWVDGVYDTTLFNGIAAASSPKSANINGTDGYVVYISDRRGDRVKGERNTAGSTIQTTNGMVDNEDIYGANQADGAAPDAGEDVIDEGYDPGTSANKKGTLQVDKCELPSPGAIPGPTPTGTTPSGVTSANFLQGITVADWNPAPPSSMSTACSGSFLTNNKYWFRRSVRVFNGEKLQITAGANKLSTTKGITISTENMVYIWGNFNTDGINVAPSTGTSSLNLASATSHYMPTSTDTQVPASIVADAIFPISKTWYDALPAMYPEGSLNRVADAGSASDTAAIGVTEETSVRAGIIAGSTLSSMASASSAPTYYLDNLNGGVHNFPRFLETWGDGSTWTKRWNYVGSFITLYSSLQAVGPWSVVGSYVYYPPIRNWAFDITFTDPLRLPPGTPQFQHIEPTGFRQIL